MFNLKVEKILQNNMARISRKLTGIGEKQRAVDFD